MFTLGALKLAGSQHDGDGLSSNRDLNNAPWSGFFAGFRSDTARPRRAVPVDPSRNPVRACISW